MAVSFPNDSTKYLSRASSLISSGDPRPCSVHVRYKPNTTGSQQTIFVNNQASYGPGAMFGIDSADKMYVYSVGYSLSNTFGLDTNWWSLVWTWAADNSVAFYANGSSAGTNTLAHTAGGSDGCELGRGNTSLSGIGFVAQGLIAEFAMWSAVLTAAEAASLAVASPMLVRPQSLVSYPSMVRPDGTDRKLSVWTVNGSPSAADHPRVIYPRRKQVVVASAAAPASTIGFLRDNAGCGAMGGGPFSRSNAGLGVLA